MLKLPSRLAAAVAPLALVLVLGLSLAGAGPSATAAEDPPAGRFEALDRYVQKQMAELGLPGAAVAVVEQGRVAHVAAFGAADANGRALTPRTPVLLASTSKSLTAIAVMQQVDAGRLDLAAPVRDYLPWFATADGDASAGITVGQLLNHTSGFSTRDGVAYQAWDDRDPGALERGVRELAGAVLVDAPGASFTYSNLNYDILALLVQTVSGEAFDQYLQRHIFAPLQMVNSHATADDAEDDGAAAGFYHWFGTVWAPARIPVPATGMGSATLYSSAEDLSHVLVAHLAGGQYAGTSLLSPRSAAALLSPTATVDEFSSYAMGWFARPMWESLEPAAPRNQMYNLPLLLEHNGTWSNSQSYLALVPGEGLGLAVLVNGADQGTPSLALALNANIVRILHGMDPVPAAAQEEPLQQYGWAVALLFLLLLLVSLTLTARVVYRWIHGTGPRRPAAVLLLPLLLDAVVLWAGLAYVPAHFDADLPVILRTVPDVGIFLLPALLVAGVWGAARTVLLAGLWLRPARA